MENQPAEPKKTILNYGVIFGIISVFLGVVMYITNAYLQPHWAYTLLGFIVFVIVVSLGIKAFKTENRGFLSLGEALKVGVGIALIGGIIVAVWSFALMTIIEPDYMANMAEIQREQMVERFPDMSQQQIDDASEMSGKFLSPWITIPVSLVVNLFFGLIIALFAGLVMRQQRPYEV